jgi:hypothetical protein
MQYEIMRKITTAKLLSNAHEIWGDTWAIANAIYHIDKIIMTSKLPSSRADTVITAAYLIWLVSKEGDGNQNCHRIKSFFPDIRWGWELR